jgi:hypothetical protein
MPPTLRLVRYKLLVAAMLGTLQALGLSEIHLTICLLSPTPFFARVQSVALPRSFAQRLHRGSDLGYNSSVCPDRTVCQFLNVWSETCFDLLMFHFDLRPHNCFFFNFRLKSTRPYKPDATRSFVEGSGQSVIIISIEIFFSRHPYGMHGFALPVFKSSIITIG